jgi:tripartite-type tricarboxylate transporter receptor subunit TctC
MRFARWIPDRCAVSAASGLTVFVTLLGLAGQAFAQAYPAKPVKVIVAFAPGSATDILARVMADHFTKSMGQPFVVENKPGAGGIPGTEFAKNAAPDGYTLTMCPSGPFGINPAIYSKLPTIRSRTSSRSATSASRRRRSWPARSNRTRR